MTFQLAFRIFYTSFFTLLNIVLLGLLLITPADAIHQALQNDQLYYVFVIAGCYFVTVLLAILVYASRLYTNRSVLAAIPKTWVPVEKGDVNEKVRKMIAANLVRSAAIAWDSRPRSAPQPTTVVSEPDTRDAVAKPLEPGKTKRGLFGRRETKPEKDDAMVAIPPHKPVWGDIAHNGWSSPTSPDLPNLQYTTVILELPHLIEARAVSLAPPEPGTPAEPPIPDIRAVTLLHRPSAQGLRDYISHLTSLRIFENPTIATSFLSSYEYARFSDRPLSEPQFRNLMKQFSELLKSMTPLGPATLANLDMDQDDESDIDEDASSTPTERSYSLAPSPSMRSFRTASSDAGSEGTVRTAPSRRRDGTGTSNSTPGRRGRRHAQYSTAPATPRGRKAQRAAVSRSASVNSFAQSRGIYTGSSGGTSSSAESASASESPRSTSQGSVIVLNRSDERGQLPEVPYTLIIPPAR